MQSRLKRANEEREADFDEIRQKQLNDKNQLEEKIIKEKKDLRDIVDAEQLDMNKRLDKLNLDRMSDMADVQAKMGLVGKSASRHLETLRAQLFRECQTLFELATKPCSIVFDAFRLVPDILYNSPNQILVTSVVLSITKKGFSQIILRKVFQ